MIKRIVLVLVACLALLFLVDLLWPDHHHAHYPWHTIAGFDALYGFVGCLLLGGLALLLGHGGLWRPIRSVLLREEQAGDALHGELERNAVREGQYVSAGALLAELRMAERQVQVHAPSAGVVWRLHFDPGDRVCVGETIADLQVGREILGSHGEGEA